MFYGHCQEAASDNQLALGSYDWWVLARFLVRFRALMHPRLTSLKPTLFKEDLNLLFITVVIIVVTTVRMEP